MTTLISTIALLFSLLADHLVQASITCGQHLTPQTRCYGSGAYCCGIYNDECCWETVYSYWWFWFIWVWVFILIVACSVCVCIRRRRRLAGQTRYVIVESQPTYGAVTPGPQAYPPMAPQGYRQEHPGGAMPPTAPSYMEKPPPYTPATGN